MVLQWRAECALAPQQAGRSGSGIHKASRKAWSPSLRSVSDIATVSCDAFHSFVRCFRASWGKRESSANFPFEYVKERNWWPSGIRLENMWDLRLTPVVMMSSVFWDITPCSPLKVDRVLSPAFTLVSCSAYSTLKMEAICSSETSVDFQRTKRRYIPEDSTH
jgi:hypothetical protein